MPRGSALLRQLRMATAEHHQRIERDSPLMRADLTPDGYRAVLVRLHGYDAPWEAEAGSIWPELINKRRKVPLLEADLRRLGREVNGPHRPPHCPTRPSLRSKAELLGAMYGLEGATLGGSYVARHLGGTLGQEPGRCDSFFRSYGTRVRSMWQEFLEILAAHSSAQADPVIVGRAVETFAALGGWLGVANP